MYFIESAKGNPLNLPKHSARVVFALCIMGIFLLHTGCTVGSALKGKKGVDIGGIKPGIRKVKVEEILGPSEHEWWTSSGICYRAYVYDAGIPSSASDAAAFVFLDVVTFGIFELYDVIEPFPVKRKSKKMAVSYDASDMVIGVFDCYEDFDELPTDGRAEK